MNKAAWQGAVVFVTGGGSGIGRQLAKAISARGGIVIVTDINAATAATVAVECGPQATSHALDVTDANAVTKLVSDTFEKYKRLDYIFNNAGIGAAGEAFEIPASEWERLINVNLRGVLNGVLAAYPIMIKQGGGHIVNTASLAGLGPAPLMAPYGMTKHAVVGLSTSLRLEAEKYNVKVSVLCPAAIETPILNETTDTNWIPDMRRYLTNLAGPPLSVEQFGESALMSIEANEEIIVIPGRAKASWIIGRLFPGIVGAAFKKAMALERSFRK